MSANSSASSRPQRIGILGSGQMGGAAAVMFCRAGYDVSLWSRNAEKLAAVQPALDAVEAFLTEHFGPASAPGTLHLETDFATIDAASDAVFECIAEDIEQKTALLSELKSCRDRGALVMTCTSALCITDLAHGSGMETVLVGAHFWNPPHLIPVVEVVAGAETPESLVEAACALLTRAGKVPVRCADVRGFVGNRLMHAMWREALAMVEAGVCSAEDIDRVVKWTFALRLPALGPMENMDLVGLGLVNSVQSYVLPDLATNAQTSSALTDRLQRGESGMKAGRGFYDWSERDPAATIALRDRQIVRQLQFLREAGAFDHTTSSQP